MEIKGSRVLVTGASQGIGAATAVRFAALGAHVHLVARDERRLKDLADRIAEAGGSASAHPVDLADPTQITELARQVEAPDVLVNNARAGRWLFLDETPPAELLSMAAVPYLAAALLTREFLGGMRARGRGWIVTVDSPVSRMPIPGATGYQSARWALRGLTESPRLDLRGTPIGVSEVVPGKVSSSYFENNPGVEERIPKTAKSMPTLTPEQVADAIAEAVLKECDEVFLPALLRGSVTFGRLFPRLSSYVSWKTGTHR